MITLNYLIIILSGIFGLALAGYIHRKKVLGEKLICPTGSSCESVINSKYGRFLEIPIENLGVFYYLFITISYTVFLFQPEWNSEIFSFLILAITTISFLFSIYLIFAQLLILREWCLWCIISTLLCAIIFIMAWNVSELDLIGFINIVINSIGS